MNHHSHDRPDGPSHEEPRGHSHGRSPGHPHDEPHGLSHDEPSGHSHDEPSGHSHDRSHEQSHDHAHGHPHDDSHDHPQGIWGRLVELVAPHSHDAADKIDSALESSREGLRALWISLAALGVTALLQAVVVLWSSSVALLGDTLHNLADALTALPLALAFVVGRRPANRRYTYGYGRAEDLAGVFIVGVIAASAVVAGWEAVDRLMHPAQVSHLGAVAGAAIIGFLGNEAVAQLRIRVGRRIGSAALVADGLHARTDGFTSLAVLLGAGGVAIGWDWADPVVGLLITVAILFVLKDAAREVYRRLMDAVDPAVVDACEQALRATHGVEEVSELRLRWIGHRLRAECTIVVNSGLSLVEGHDIAVAAEHELLHHVPKLQAALVHADPAAVDGKDHHAGLAHHRGDE